MASEPAFLGRDLGHAAPAGMLPVVTNSRDAEAEEVERAAAVATAPPTRWLTRSTDPLLIATLLLVTAIYLPTLAGPFLWDDYTVFVRDERAHSLSAALAAFGDSFWPDAGLSQNAARGYFRPLVVLSYALDHTLWGAGPRGPRLSNLLLHLTSLVLVYLLGRRHGGSSAPAMIAALLWGLAPRSTEVVAWISGRADALSTVLGLAALWVWPAPTGGGAAPPRALARRGGAALLLLLALLCKESAAAVVACILVMELAAARARASPPSSARALTAGLGRSGPVLAVSAFYLALRVAATGWASGAVDRLRPSERGALVLEALGRYTAMVIDPWRPQLEIGSVGTRSLPFAALGALSLVAVLAFVVRRRHALKPDELGLLALMLVGIGVVSHVVPFHTNVVAADRYLYLPLAALSLFGAKAASTLSGRRRRNPPRAQHPEEEARSAQGTRPIWAAVALGLALALALSFTLATHARAAIWASEPAFWRNMLETSPGRGCRPLAEMALALQRSGRPRAALALYDAVAARGCADTAKASFRLNRALAKLSLGDIDAGTELLAALANGPGAGQRPLEWLARAQVMRFDFDAAAITLQRAHALGQPSAGLKQVAEALPSVRAHHELLIRESGRLPEIQADMPPALLRALCGLNAAAGREHHAVRCFHLLALDDRFAPKLRLEAAQSVVTSGPLEAAAETLTALEAEAGESPVIARLRAFYEARVVREQPYDELKAWLRQHPRLGSFFRTRSPER